MMLSRYGRRGVIEGGSVIAKVSCCMAMSSALVFEVLYTTCGGVSKSSLWFYQKVKGASAVVVGTQKQPSKQQTHRTEEVDTAR